ncbi:hypothetical protein UK23_23120 [Lentzea aerocolonigenes]|uniref:ABM domain-containing protein n=1 Tax=Lentzea aerocolonigenes TaxID=68170 RepID=A0A0F0GX39_LENAE|nr:hypothetical protein [Lentzea aerocolonigenes]KJK46572.1 hypothetical protein UK23_23120 [Lentzea aerocolonigenes]
MWLTIATPPTDSLETLDKMMNSLVPDGLRARYACRADGKFQVIAVWESKEHADRFFHETLGPVIARVLGPTPAGGPAVNTGMEVLREFVPAVS